MNFKKKISLVFLILLCSYISFFQINFEEINLYITSFILIYLIIIFLLASCILYLNKSFFSNRFDIPIFLSLIFIHNSFSFNFEKKISIFIIIFIFCILLFSCFYRTTTYKFFKFTKVFSVLFLIYNLLLLSNSILNINDHDIVFNKNNNLNNYKVSEKSKNFFLKSTFFIVLDEHPSPLEIKNFYKNSSFFLEYLSSNNFETFTITSPIENISTQKSMSLMLNPHELSNKKKDQVAVIRGKNIFHDLTNLHKVNYLFLDGAATDALITCDDKYVDKCIKYRTSFYYSNANTLAYFINRNLFDLVANKSLSNKIFNIAENFTRHGNYSFSWEKYRGMVKDFFPEIPNLKKYEPFFIYTHFINPHGPYVADKNCKKHDVRNNLKDLKYFEGFLICTNKMTIEYIKKIEKNFKNPNIIIVSDTGMKLKNHLFLSIKSKSFDKNCKKFFNKKSTVQYFMENWLKCLDLKK